MQLIVSVEFFFDKDSIKIFFILRIKNKRFLKKSNNITF